MNVSKNSDADWKNDAIQFPRLIAEIEAAGGLGGDVLDDVASAMDLPTERVMEIVDRAQTTWDAIKDPTSQTSYLGGAPVYLGGDLYVQDEETVTRLFFNEHGSRTPMIELSNEEAQALFNELAKRRGTVKK